MLDRLYVAGMFGDVLRTAREKAGLTQEQLAFTASLHRTYISLLERNLKSPTLEVLLRIGKALKILPHDWLNALSLAVHRTTRMRENIDSPLILNTLVFMAGEVTDGGLGMSSIAIAPCSVRLIPEMLIGRRYKKG